MTGRTSNPRALALPIVLWSIAFIAGLVVLVAGMVGEWSTEEAQAGRRFQARQQALSGIALGLNPAVEAGDPLLKSGNADEGFEVKISDEAGRINPNFWIIQNDRNIFTTLFESWNVDPSLHDAAIDGLIDWIDQDDFRSLAGAELGEYQARGRPGFPANRQLVHIREMEAIIGLDAVLASRPDWREYFTTWHSGKINVHHAGERVLTTLGLLTPLQFNALFELRAGPDGIEGNADDVRFESIADVAAVVGADSLQLKALESYFDVGGSVRRIESTGTCYGTKHRITVIVSGENSAEIMNWEER